MPNYIGLYIASLNPYQRCRKRQQRRLLLRGAVGTRGVLLLRLNRVIWGLGFRVKWMGSILGSLSRGNGKEHANYYVGFRD